MAALNLRLAHAAGQEGLDGGEEGGQGGGGIGDALLLELDCAAVTADGDGGAEDDMLLSAFGDDAKPLVRGRVKEQPAHVGLLAFAEAMPDAALNDVAVVAQTLRLVAAGHWDLLREGPGAGETEVGPGGVTRLIAVHEGVLQHAAERDTVGEGRRAQPARAGGGFSQCDGRRTGGGIEERGRGHHLTPPVLS